MKRYLSLFLILCMFFLAGCEDASAKVSNPNEVLLKVGNQKVTKQEVYEYIRGIDSAAMIMNEIETKIVNSEVETTLDIEQQAQADLAEAKESYGESFEMFMQYLGYTDEDTFYNDYLLPQTKKANLQNTYINENWGALVEEYYPAQVQIIETETPGDATAVLSEYEAGKSFDELAERYTTNSSELYDGKVHVISSNDETTLPANIIDFVKQSTTIGLSPVMQNTNGDRFYVVNLVSKNADDFKDEAISAIQSSSTLNTSMMAYYYKKHNFEVYDVTLRDYLQANYPTYLGTQEGE